MQTPKHFTECYTDGLTLVILGTPKDEDGSDDFYYHNCDEMGCGGFSHVLLRLKLTFEQQKAIADTRAKGNIIHGLK